MTGSENIEARVDTNPGLGQWAWGIKSCKIARLHSPTSKKKCMSAYPHLCCVLVPSFT